MAAPTTPILDDFNRGDGPLGANWTAIFSTSEPLASIISSQAGQVSGTSSGYWSPTTFAADQECYYSGNGVLGQWDCWVRATGFHPTLIPDTGYVLDCAGDGQTATLYKADGIGGVTSIGSTTAGNLRGLWVRAVGANIKAYAYDGAAWYSLLDITDSVSPFLNAGYIGFEMTGGGETIDNFGGGNIVSGPAPITFAQGSRW